jgi:hypothetical protein
MSLPITIETGIPLPIRSGDTGLTHTLRTMLPGESFKIETKRLQTIRISARRAGVTIATRKIDNNFTRVWKLASEKGE